jgi:hypothetical protein
MAHPEPSRSARAQVWALAVGGAGEPVLATGGADARVNLWRDCTAADEDSAAAERAEAAQRAQELANALQARSLPPSDPSVIGFRVCPWNLPLRDAVARARAGQCVAGVPSLLKPHSHPSRARCPCLMFCSPAP